MDLLEYKNFAEELVLAAGQILLEERKGLKIAKYKDSQDIATTADLASEKYIITEIEKRFPNHSILSEEKGETKKETEFRWVIDPLDGTKEYFRGIPLYNVSLALEQNGELIISALFRPQESSLYSAAKGLGSYLNKDQKIKVSSLKNLSESFVYCYLPSFRRQQDKYAFAWNKLKTLGERVYRLRSLADENTSLCWLAQGGIEAYVNLSNPPKWHDIAPGILIAKEAGALVEKKDGSLIVANNQEIYNQIMEVINE